MKQKTKDLWILLCIVLFFGGMIALLLCLTISSNECAESCAKLGASVDVPVYPRMEGWNECRCYTRLVLPTEEP